MNFKCQKSGCGGNHHTLMHRYTTATGEESKTGTGLKENKVDSNNGNVEQQSPARQRSALPRNVTGAGNDRETTVAITGARENRVCLGIVPVKVK